MALKNDIAKVFGANSIVFLVNILNGFVLPFHLSIDDFALLKTYALYIGFIGIFHFGFVDGINITFGGKKDIKSLEIVGNHNFFVLFQLILSLLFLIISIFLRNKILILTSLTVLPFNLHYFYLLFYQAVGEFKIYSKATIIPPLVVLIATLILLISGVRDYAYYASAIIVSYASAIVFMEFVFRKQYNMGQSFFKGINYPVVKGLFKVGVFILLGNILFLLLLSLGRLFVKIFLDNTDFAVFSLAVSMLSMITLFTNSVTLTFYPYLAGKSDLSVTKKFKRNFLVIGGAALLGFFPIKYIILNFLPKYSESIAVTGVLLATIPGLFILQSLYVNIYKVKKKERNFLYDSLKYLLISVVMHLVMYFIFRNLIAISIATLASIYIWAFWPSKTTNELAFKFSEICFVVILIGIYLFIIFHVNSIMLGTFIYFVLCVGLCFIFLKNESISIINRVLLQLKSLSK
jgi:O-antigen/teichoic acid export membrane protein